MTQSLFSRFTRSQQNLSCRFDRLLPAEFQVDGNRDFLDNWIELKKKEYDALRLRPHPYEFFMYFDL